MTFASGDLVFVCAALDAVVASTSADVVPVVASEKNIVPGSASDVVPIEAAVDAISARTSVQLLTDEPDVRIAADPGPATDAIVATEPSDLIPTAQSNDDVAPGCPTQHVVSSRSHDRRSLTEARRTRHCFRRHECGHDSRRNDG